MTEHPMLTWYLAQLDKLEATARAASPGPWSVRDPDDDYWPAVLDANGGYVVGAQSWDMYGRHAVEMDLDDVRHIAAHDPASVLADIAMKRALLGLHRISKYTNVDLGIRDVAACGTCLCLVGEPEDWPDDQEWPYPLGQQIYPCPTLRLLVSALRDRPGYDEAWGPEVER